MATYLELYDLRYSDELKKRVTVAIAIAAQQTLAEAPSTTDHANRIAWANEALADTQLMTEKIMWRVLGNASIAASGLASTDGDLQFTVNSILTVITKAV